MRALEGWATHSQDCAIVQLFSVDTIRELSEDGPAHAPNDFGHIKFLATATDSIMIMDYGDTRTRGTRTPVLVGDTGLLRYLVD